MVTLTNAAFVLCAGIFTLGEKLGMDATEDIRILVLLWKMGCTASKPGEISKEEWMQGCVSLGVDSWDKINQIKYSPRVNQV